MGDKNFRLSPHVRPNRYRYTVVPDLLAARFTGAGTVEIDVQEPVPALVLHGHHLEVQSARVDGNLVSVTLDEDSQTLSFATGTLGAGPHTLDVEWSGLLHRDLRGFYLAGGNGVTQFEAADARRVFPCCDEPPFKAVWEISVEAPAELAVIGNGAIEEETALDGGRKRVRFQATPRLSSYLVALVVGKLVPSSVRVARHIPIRTWATPEKAGLAEFGQECAAAVLPLLEDYFGTPYVFGKLDQVGVPDFEAGAMENAGCITFREILLLIDPTKTPLSLIKRVAEVITHELAHQWFGNLVTMQWWDDLWLNEAFATWMAYKIVDQWRPQWRMWDDFAAGKAAALHLDAMESTHPIRAEVRNADEASENFDLITYEKGGAMLRMIEGYLGAEPFRDGIADYMKRHAWGNTVADDLWRALGRSSGQPVEAVANGWIGRPGFPLVTVAQEAGQGGHVVLRLSQQRFFTDAKRFAAASDAAWLVPLVVAWKDDAGIHESRLLLEGERGEMTLSATGKLRWVCANRAGAGFYRVRYDAAGLAALATHRADLEPVERMGILSDAAALFHAGAAPLSSLLDLLEAYAADDDYAVLGDVVALLDSVDRRLAREADRGRWRALVGTLLEPQLAQLGWEAATDEKDDRRLRRAAAVRGLVLVARSAPAIAEATARFVRTLDGGAPLENNLLDLASVASARGGDVALFERFEERARNHADPSEKRRALVSLASFESPALVERLVALLDSDTVPLQDVTIVLGTLLANRATRDRTWTHVRTTWTALRKRLAPSLLRRTVESLRELGHRRAEVEQFFTDEHESLTSVPAAVSQTRERMRLDAESRARAEPQLAAWLDARSR